MKSLTELQAENREWALKNFGPDVQLWEPVMGAAEEVGELCHSILKMRQGIRVNEDHRAKAIDAACDTIVYLMDFANRFGFDLHAELCKTWADVSQRDWTKNKNNGAVTP